MIEFDGEVQVVNELDERITEIQQKIIQLNDEADNITTKALSNAKTSDLTEYQQTLVNAIVAIQQATGENIEEEGILNSFWNKFASKFGFAKKMQKTIEEKFIENATLQENIDTIFTALEGSIQSTEQDLNTLYYLQQSLNESVKYGNELEQQIISILKELTDNEEDQIKKTKLEGLLRELKSINLVNANTANQIKAQLATTGGMAQNLREIRPILKNLLKSQTLVALQNARIGQATEVRDMVSGIVNEFVIKNNEKTNEIILDAIEYSGKTIIEKDTIKELGQQHEIFVKELKHIATDLNRQKLEYNKTVEKVTKQLNNSLNSLPKMLTNKF